MDTLLLRRLVLVSAASVALTGCAGELDNPERFTAPSTASDASVDAAMDDGPTCDVQALLEDQCATSGCHDDSARPGGELDLLSADVADRLVGQPAATCEGRMRIDPADPTGSFFIEKLGEEPECGNRMPLAGMPLDSEQMACVQNWVTSLAERGGAATDGGTDTGAEDTTADAGGAGDGGAS